MCGRFTLRTPANVLVDQFQLSLIPELTPRFNIAPTQAVAVVRCAAATGDRELVLMRWGLIPSWAKDPSIGNRMINARSETVASRPSFRSAFKRRRCLVLADGYYEWQKTGGKKQPYYIRMRDDRAFALAGLWEQWTGDRASREQSDSPLESCTIITSPSSELTQDIHDRMPVVLPVPDHDVWLDPSVHDGDRLQPLLAPYQGDDMVAEPVSTHVNSPRNDDPQCIEVLRES